MRLIFSFLLSLNFIFTAFGQTISLHGVLITDSGQPVAYTKVSIAGGQANSTDKYGRFVISLSGDFKEGEHVIISVLKSGWVINHPLDGVWPLPNIQLEHLQLVRVVIVPLGSKALWTDERIEKHIAGLLDEIENLKAEAEKPKPVDISYFFTSLGKKYHFTPEQVKYEFDNWARAVGTSVNAKTVALRAFYQKNFVLAYQSFDKSALQSQQDAYQSWKLSGHALSNLNRFREALDRYGRARSLISKENSPQQWGEISNLIGSARRRLGNRVKAEEAAFLLEDSAQAYRQALEVYTRNQSPKQWAMVQNNLGNTLYELGIRVGADRRIKLLKEAIEAYSLALEIRTRQTMPEQWATTQHNLGSVLQFQGIRTAGQDALGMLKQSEEKYRLALQVSTFKKRPEVWAMTQNALGAVLFEQGIRVEGQDGLNLLKQSEAAYRLALKVYKREKKPEEWAQAQMNLGNAIRDQGLRLGANDRDRLLNDAIKAYGLALQVLTYEQLPELWAMVQINLGITYENLADGSPGDARLNLLKKAVNCHRGVLEVRKREYVPQYWASTQYQLGNALRVLGTRIQGQAGVDLLKESEAAYRSALEVRIRDYLPQDWATTQSALGAVLYEQGIRIRDQAGLDLLKESERAYRHALEVRTRKDLPQDWAETQSNLGATLQQQAAMMQGDEAQRLLKEALAACQLALEVRTYNASPARWAQTQKNLANTYRLLKDWNKAVESYINVLKVYQDKDAYQNAAYIYHETLFDFKLALELNQRWVDQHPNDLSSLPDLAESYFTYDRFAECEKQIKLLLANQTIDPDVKAALHVIGIANLAALKKKDLILNEIDSLIELISNQPPNFTVGWSFDGTKYYISHNSGLVKYQDWLGQLIGAIEGKDRDTIQALLREVRGRFKTVD